MDISLIVESAQQQNKNILIIGTPRSGTHALASLFDNSKIQNLGEIHQHNGTGPLINIEKMYAHNNLKIAHIVQLSAKIVLSLDLKTLKQNTIIVNLKRRNKVRQFASWMYFHASGGVNGRWHNHTEQDSSLRPGSITVTAEDIDLFVTEQLTDDFFLPDCVLYYEDINFSQAKFNKNRYSYDIEQIFNNLDYVKQRLENWAYYE